MFVTRKRYNAETATLKGQITILQGEVKVLSGVFDLGISTLRDQINELKAKKPRARKAQPVAEAAKDDVK